VSGVTATEMMEFAPERRLFDLVFSEMSLGVSVFK